MGFGENASLWGMVVSGDIGDLTVYTDRFGKKVAFQKSPPKKPPTDLQIAQRERFRLAQVEYMGLTPLQKADYELLVTRASLCLTGQNLFIHVGLKGDFNVLDTIQRQHGVSVIAPTDQR